MLAPDQEMGVSIVGWTRVTAFDHAGVFYNQEAVSYTHLDVYKRQDLDGVERSLLDLLQVFGLLVEVGVLSRVAQLLSLIHI